MKPDHLPLVSVVLCTYNGEKYLPAQMDTLLNQTYRNLEFIITDDLSTDQTYALLEKYKDADPRIRLFRNPHNLGYNTNFVTAFEKARGEFIAVADQDDIWEKNKIEYIMEHLWKKEGTMMVHARSGRFFEDRPGKIKKNLQNKLYKGNDPRKMFLFNAISGHCSLFRKKLLEKAQPIPEGFYYDWWLNLVASCTGGIEGSDKIFTWQRFHDRNATAGKGKFIYRHRLYRVLPILLSCPHLSPEHRKFGEKLLSEFKKLEEKKFSFSLFRLLLYYSPIVFWYKRRLIPQVSWVKTAFRMSFANYEAD